MFLLFSLRPQEPKNISTLPEFETYGRCRLPGKILDDNSYRRKSRQLHYDDCP